MSFNIFAQAADRNKAEMLRRMFNYVTTIDTSHLVDVQTSYAYTKYSISTDRRNFLLLAVPTMYIVAHGGERNHLGESYDKVTVDEKKIAKVTRMLQRTTIPHNRKTMPVLLKYLTPNVYGVTLFNDFILSPFNRNNRRFYRYHVSTLYDGTTMITFKPKVGSTQLISGLAKIDTRSGRIIKANINGEYDMIRFSLEIEMGQQGLESIYPMQCSLQSKFKFIGNEISTDYKTAYGLSKAVPDSLHLKNDTILLNYVRPYPLEPNERAIMDKYYSQRDSAQCDTTSNAYKHKERKAKQLWDNIGETLLGRIKSNFGTNKQGHLRINPILNPLYFGFSGKKGLTYKFDVRANYSFSDNSKATLRLKSGYSFKQRQFYFTIPITYYFNFKKDGYILLEAGNGNRITNSTVADKIKHERKDSIDWSKMGLKFFNDTHLKLNIHYDVSSRMGLMGGLVFHRRSAVDHKPFDNLGVPAVYTSSAPLAEIEIRPAGYNGPIIAADYERSFKGFLGSNMSYERIELDAQYKMKMASLSSLQMRLGTGFYTYKGDDWCFLDYSNFRENNIPGGWNDSWANEFELLNSNWYNASEYYIRANCTFESPILIASWIPVLGHYIEKERIYINTLSVRRLHPYIEYGYGIRTRLFSAGMFLGQKNGKFDGFGVKFGFELFRQW